MLFLKEILADYLQDGDVVKAHISSENGEIDLGYQVNTIVSNSASV